MDANKSDMQTLFLISTVVFSHGSPVIDDFTVSIWPTVMWIVDWFARRTKWGKGMETKFGIQWKWDGNTIRFDAPSGAANRRRRASRA